MDSGNENRYTAPMIGIRRTIAALLLLGLLAPLGPLALAHAWSDFHAHRHADGTSHSHHHDADHHEGELDSDAPSAARIGPSRTLLAGARSAPAIVVSGPAAPAVARRAEARPASRRDAAPPGRDPAPCRGRAPPA